MNFSPAAHKSALLYFTIHLLCLPCYLNFQEPQGAQACWRRAGVPSNQSTGHEAAESARKQTFVWSLQVQLSGWGPQAAAPVSLDRLAAH